MKGHTDNVTSVLFSPDNNYFFSGSDDMTIRVFKIESYGGRSEIDITKFKEDEDEIIDNQDKNLSVSYLPFQ